MRGAPAAALASLLLGGAAQASVPLPEDSPVIAALDRCIADLEAEKPESDSGAELPDDADNPDAARKPPPLVARCPEAHAGLAAGALARHLPPDWDKRVSAAKLQRYRFLLTTEPVPAGRRPGIGAVESIVKETAAAVDVQNRSLWQRFKDWLRNLLERGANDATNDWLARWLEEHFPSARVIKVFLYVVLAALVGGIAWVVYSELRTAGLFGRRARAGGEAGPAGAADEDKRALTLAGASEAEAPSILLALLLEQLRRLGRAHDRNGMTHRELLRAVRFEAGADDETFRTLLGAAERLRYASVPPPAVSLRAAVESGVRLLESLVREPRSAA